MKMTSNNDDDEMKLLQVEDRLSSLPVEILFLEIMARLPLKSTIVMSSLSRSWHGRWAYKHCIDLNTIPINDNLCIQNINKSSRFWFKFKSLSKFTGSVSYGCHRWSSTSMNEALMQIKSPIIQRFDIKLPCLCRITVQSLNFYLDLWLRQICERHVEEVRIEPDCGFKLSRCRPRVRVIPTLPSCVLQSNSLKSLELGPDNNFYYHLPPIHGHEFVLPNLQKLGLSVQVADNASLNNLSNLINTCCPSLLDLSLAYGTTSPYLILEISNPSLKRLFLTRIYGSIRESQIAVDIPALEYFECRNLPKLRVSFSNYPIEAHLWFKRDFLTPPNPNALWSFLNVIPSVHSFNLHTNFTHSYSPESSYTLPLFTNLTYLSWSTSRWGAMYGLPLLLQSCPSLIHLRLHTGHLRWKSGEACKIYCLTNVVQTVEILTDLPGVLFPFIKDLLRNAQVLKQLTFDVRCRFCPSEGREKSIQIFLSKCTVASPDCNIQLSFN